MSTIGNHTPGSQQETGDRNPLRWTGQRLKRAALLAMLAGAVAIPLTACGTTTSSSTPTAPTVNHNHTVGHLSRLLLTRADLPSGYSQTTSRSGPAKDVLRFAKTRQEAAAFRQLITGGLVGYASTDFHKSVDGNSNTPGSIAFAFDSVADASRALAITRSLFRIAFVPTGDASGAQTSIPVSGLGDQSLPGVRFALGPYGLYVYIWRDRNVDVILGASDILGDLSGKSILVIAKQIDFRATS